MIIPQMVILGIEEWDFEKKSSERKFCGSTGNETG